MKNARIDLVTARKLYEEAMRAEVLSKYTFPEKPSSDGYYHVQVKDNTKTSGRRQIKAKTLEELKEKVYAFLAPTAGTTKLYFHQCYEHMIEDRIRRCKDPEKLLSVKNTTKRISYTYKKYFKDTYFEKLFIDDISKKDIENFIETILNENSLTKKEFSNIKSFLSIVFDYAYSEELIEEDIFRRVRFQKFNDMFKQQTPIEERVHSDEEMNGILAEVISRQNGKKIAPYALELQIRIGARRGEIPPLLWSDVQDGAISISKEMIGETIVNHTKNYKPRLFPVTDEIQSLLDRVKTSFPSDTLIFPGLTYKSTYAVYKSVCTKMGLSTSNACRKGPHSFRRNGITTVVKNTGNIFLASQLYGNNPQTAGKHYFTGIDMDAARAALAGKP